MGYPPLTQGKTVFRGFIGGGLVVSGLLSPWGDVARVILFILGIFVLFDCCMRGRNAEVYILTALLSAIVGGVIMAIISLLGWGWVLTIPFVLAALILIVKQFLFR